MQVPAPHQPLLSSRNIVNHLCTSGRNSVHAPRLSGNHLNSRFSGKHGWSVQCHSEVASSLSAKTSTQELEGEGKELDVIEDSWQAIRLLRRQMEIAVAEEDYGLASELRDQVKAKMDMLPPVQQYMFTQLDKLKNGMREEQLTAVKHLGASGYEFVVPELAAMLYDSNIQKEVEEALWMLFMRSHRPETNELMRKGANMMATGKDMSECLDLFEEMKKSEPSFGEGFNKCATVLYLMKNYEESIANCRMVVELQPYHFAAFAGMGLCHYHLKDYRQAVDAFEQALQIHPGLNHIRRLTEQLRKELDEGLELGEV